MIYTIVEVDTDGYAFCFFLDMNKFEELLPDGFKVSYSKAIDEALNHIAGRASINKEYSFIHLLNSVVAFTVENNSEWEGPPWEEVLVSPPCQIDDLIYLYIKEAEPDGEYLSLPPDYYYENN